MKTLKNVKPNDLIKFSNLSGNYVTLSVTCNLLYFLFKLEFSSISEDHYYVKLKIMCIREYEKYCKKINVSVDMATWGRISGKISE